MSLRRRLVVPVIFSALAVLAGCGGSSGTTKGTPPPTGGFSNTNLNGTYVFSVTGSDSSNGFFQTIAGTFIANGTGAITAGVMDVNGESLGPITNQAITSGSYSVGADGRASSPSRLLTLTTSAGSFQFAFVLTSSSHGLITEFDSNGSGSGTLDLQANVSQTNINSQSYAFNFTGASGATNVICGIPEVSSVSTPFASAGAFTMGASGTSVTTGVEDFNSNCSSSGLTDLPIGPGSSVNLGTVPGTAVLATNAGTFNFDVYPVDTTHLKFIEVDAGTVLSGDAFTQASSIPTGNLVFSLAGFDTIAGGFPFSTAGIFNADGNGNITGSSVQDINDGGVAAGVASGISGNYIAVTGGRSVLTLTSGFFNGGNLATACTNCQFAAYPSSGGLQLLEIDNGGITAGTAFTQNNPSFGSAQGFGVNWSGANSSGFEEDDIVEFTNNSGTLGPGVIDSNQMGVSQSFGQKYQASYAADSTVSGRGVVTPQTNAFNLVMYGIDSQNQVIISIDPNFVGIGSAVQQNASAMSSAAVAHLAVLQARPVAAKAMKKRAAR
jgi:hypothetical protein